MGRNKSETPKIRVTFYISVEMADFLTAYGKRKFMARGRVIEELIHELRMKVDREYRKEHLAERPYSQPKKVHPDPEYYADVAQK